MVKPGSARDVMLVCQLCAAGGKGAREICGVLHRAIYLSKGGESVRRLGQPRDLVRSFNQRVWIFVITWIRWCQRYGRSNRDKWRRRTGEEVVISSRKAENTYSQQRKKKCKSEVLGRETTQNWRCTNRWLCNWQMNKVRHLRNSSGEEIKWEADTTTVPPKFNYRLNYKTNTITFIYDLH